jgi:hypothetical protein
MPQALLGIIERFGPGKSGPGARLRPIFLASIDKSHWIPPEEEYPNSGVISWWQPVPDADVYKAWTFHIEPSWTYDAGTEHHDYYGVKGSPVPPVELIELPGAHDPEDVRSLLLEEGIPLERCVSKLLVFRDSSGFIVGPLDLTARDRRLFLEEKDTYVPLSQENGNTPLAEWHGHIFMPPENGIRRVGEVDFSSNSVFMRRVLREVREIPLAEIETAKLTAKVIGAYIGAFEKSSLNPFQAQRLRRLHKMARHASDGIALGEDALPDLLSLPAVQKLISTASERAVRSAVEARQSTFDELDARRVELEAKVRDLQVEDERLRSEITISENQQAKLLESFERRVQEKFEEVGKSATSFLSDVALIRAALFPTAVPPVRRPVIRTAFPQAEALDASHLKNALRKRFEDRGLGYVLPATLLSSWTAGYVPMLFGALARDAVLSAADTLFGGVANFVTMGPTYSSPAELMGLRTTSPFSVGTVEEAIAEASRSEGLTLLVFDNANLSQIDSVLMPLFRSYVAAHGNPTNFSTGPYPTAAGMWPSNLLLAGVLIDSPLALPLSTEVWACSTFIDASKNPCPKSAEQVSGQALALSRLSQEQWREWGKTIDWTPPASDTGVLATRFNRQVDGSSLSRGMLRRLAAAIDMTASTLEEIQRTKMLAEIAVVPQLLARHVQPDVVLSDAPVDISTDVAFVDRVTELFEKWGLKVSRES